jgi:DNA-binding transcriptional ArsR family regulator
MADLELDLNLIKAISSDKRIDILKLLNKGRKTPTDIAKELQLSTPTTLEHLDKLIENDLVQRIDEGRKWKYYSLTNKGELLVNSNNSKREIPVRIFITLGIGLLMLLIPFTMYNPFLPQMENEDLRAVGIEEDSFGIMENAPKLMMEIEQQEIEPVKDNTMYYLVQIIGLFISVYGATKIYSIVKK